MATMLPPASPPLVKSLCSSSDHTRRRASISLIKTRLLELHLYQVRVPTPVCRLLVSPGPYAAFRQCRLPYLAPTEAMHDRADTHLLGLAPVAEVQLQGIGQDLATGGGL